MLLKLIFFYPVLHAATDVFVLFCLIIVVVCFVAVVAVAVAIAVAVAVVVPFVAPVITVSAPAAVLFVAPVVAVELLLLLPQLSLKLYLNNTFQQGVAITVYSLSF